MSVPGTLRGILVSSVLLGLSACAAWNGQGAKPSGDSAVAELALLLSGVYNNHAQVWRLRQQGQAAPLFTRVVIEPAADGGAGERHLLYSQFKAGTQQEELLRRVRWVLRTGNEPQTVVQSVFQQSGGEWQEWGGCSVYWHKTEAGYQGRTRGSGCRFRAQSSEQVVVFQREFALTPAGLTYRQSLQSPGGDPQSQSLQLARLVPYAGWAGVRPERDVAPAGGDWRLDDAIRVHNQGGTAQLMTGDGQRLGYTVKLEQLVWPDSGIPMLRLGVLDSETGELLAYAWAEPDARRIGLNLGWLQVGLEREH